MKKNVDNTVPLVTPVVFDAGGFSLAHSDDVLLVGSCFAEYIGRRLDDARFNVMTNPFGIVYNPFSMADVVERCIEGKEIGESDIAFRDGLWHSWLHHGSFSRPSADECLAVCNAGIERANRFIERCSTVILTFGSAWCYTLPIEGTARVVANCHKFPQSCFERRLASVDEIVSRWHPLVQQLVAQGKKLLFTVSPVRHWAYGAHGNQLGKAALLLAIEQLDQHYFPSYEIFMDELRDYRFYADDMLHPSSLAQEIVWQRVKQYYMSATTRDICDKADALNRLCAHRLLHADLEAEQALRERIASMEKELDELLDNEKKQVI